MVDLKAKPYNLDDAGVKWVKDTIANMTIEEKIGQLFVNMGASTEAEYLKSVVDTYHIGAVRYNPAPAEVVYEQNKVLQENSKIPLLIAANTEAGGNGACGDGTYVGHPIKIAATQDKKYAYEMGRISGIEAAAIGCNWSFAPVVDLDFNWRNPIISTRTYGDDVDTVLEYSLEYMRGIMESGIKPAAKHFPGDGVDERDQHLTFAPNTLSVEEWDKTFGKIYSGLIEAGLPSIMAGHIALPEYVSKFNPNATVKERNMPATLSKYIITDLLKDQMNFNGVVVTDASHMVAMTSAMKRSEMLPTAIAAGCDLFLFFNDPDEDFAWMMEGYKNGIITDERLEDALTRILGLKASIGLHTKAKTEIMPPKEEALAKVGKAEYKTIADEISDKGITLVKNNQPDIFPLSPEKTKRVLLVNAKGHDGGFGKFIAMMMGGGKKTPTEMIKEMLEKEGFEVTIWESTIDRIMALPEGERKAAMANVYAGKKPIADLVSKYDLIINIANVNPSTDQRLQFDATKGTPDMPFYVFEIPTIFISVQCPFHLADAPQVQTYINTYDDKEATLRILVDKLMGRSEFKGVSAVDAFCGLEDTRY